MRHILLALPILAATSCAFAPAALACDGKAEVEASFVKQQKQPWRTVIKSKSDSGVEQEQRFDFAPPDRMYRKVVSGEETVETIAIGRWAWSNIGGGYSELQPQFAQMATSYMQQSFQVPKVSVDFTCLGATPFDGKSYTGYQTAPEKDAKGKEIARTILVDAATGLPAFNVIGPPVAAGEPLQQESFTYPDDIKIDKPFGN